jgi:uncharacterized protein involved in exopolysaccharide biosynthesis
MAAYVKSKAVVFSEKLYARMLAAYPKAHREEYGPSMAQLFRDQCRDAWGEARSWALLKLWLRVVPDVIATSLLEHCATLNKRKSMFNRTLFGRLATPLYTFFTVFTLVFLLVLGASVLITNILPESFASTARIKVEPYGYRTPTQTDPQQTQLAYDPYFIQTEIEDIQSEVVLRKVVEQLNLNQKWGRKYGNGSLLKTYDTLDLLKRSIDLRPLRSTSLIEIRAFSSEPEEAAKIANAIAEAYRVHHLDVNHEWTLSRIKVLDNQWNEQNAQLENAQQDLEKVRGKIQVPTPAPAEDELLATYPAYAKAKRQLDELRQFRSVLGMKIAQERTDLMLPKNVPDEIIDHAVPNHRPVRPNKPLNIVLGALFGIVLGSIAGAGVAGISFLRRRNSQTKSDSPPATGLQV